jgi:predicted 3-demethylubiquinone-9 3-methyltransferase (glyoxalase superfamily)
MEKITPCLWFDSNAEEAVNFYINTFRNGKITGKTYYDESTVEVSKKPVGSVLTVSFRLFGREYMAMNGGPEFKFNMAVSLIVECRDQKEVDRLWLALTESGGQESQCGWLTDRFGLPWQIVPKEYLKLMNSKDKKRVVSMNAAMMQMKKLDMAELRKAYKG